MPRFMVSCIMNDQQAPSQALMDDAQQHFVELMKEGYLLSAHVNHDWLKCWLLMQASDQDFVSNLLKTSPLHGQMTSVIDLLEE